MGMGMGIIILFDHVDIFSDMVFSPTSGVDSIVATARSALVAVFRKRKHEFIESSASETESVETGSKKMRKSPGPGPCRHCQAGLPGHISHLSRD